MQRTEAHNLSGPRAYFTAFDYRIVSRTKNKEQLKLKISRRLKALLLVKPKIVCAASHLATPFAYDFFRENPRLISESHITPALRSDKTDIGEL